MFNVFTDFHHAGLLQSLILLFEKRLGGIVYRPIGKDWYEKGFWKVYDHPATAEQYLGVGGATPDGSPPLNDIIGSITNHNPIDGVYYCQDIDSGSYNRAITFDAFMTQPIDVVIASLPQHIEPFKQLCSIHPNHPKLIYQIGNAWNIPDNSVMNVMASALIPNIPPNINFVSYHQEFDLSIFAPYTDDIQPYKESRVISSFVNCFNVQGHFAEDWQLFQDVERLMSDWSFKCHGGQGRDGAVNGAKEVAHAMSESMFVWHTKNGGDGYGHIIHNAAAMGKPLIVKKSYYHGKMAEPLLVDGETCIVIDGLSSQKVVDKILVHTDPLLYKNMCNNVYRTFKEQVDFEKEQERLIEFFRRL